MPRLRILRADNIPIREISVFTLLISPTLRAVNVSFVLEEEDDADMAPHAVDSLLHTIPLVVPDLEDFSYDVDFTLVCGRVNLVDGHLESFRLHFTTVAAKNPVLAPKRQWCGSVRASRWPTSAYISSVTPMLHVCGMLKKMR